MNEKLRKHLDRLDYDKNGKIDVADAELVLQEYLHGSMFRAALLGFVVGAIVATVLGAVL